MIKGSRKNYFLSIEVTTSTIEGHNSFDYQATVEELSHTVCSAHRLPLDHQYISMFRNQKTFQVHFAQNKTLKMVTIPETCDLLGIFQVRYVNKMIVLRVYDIQDLQRDFKCEFLTDKTFKNKQFHHPYIVVRSLKDQHQQSTGYKLQEGSFLRIGQKEYFISSICNQADRQDYEKNKKFMNIGSIIFKPTRIVIPNQPQKGQCKYCMMQEGDNDEEFLCSPCKCSGSCAQVHFHCLERWNQSKVKKDQVKGLTHYNFDKFFCEVCKEEYPKFIDRGQKTYELMPIKIPKGEHLILEEIQMKNACLICVEGIPLEGIRLGRGNQCEIRVDAPSISRNHARIIKRYGDYYVFDNKSKFGTLIKDSKLYLQLDFTKKGIQIDRTVMMFQICKQQI